MARNFHPPLAGDFSKRKDQMKAKAAPNVHESFCLETATHFVAVRGRTPLQRVRYEVASLDAAKAIAEGYGDKRTMIYAVNALGNSAHICNA
jgi:hypothetical protein